MSNGMNPQGTTQMSAVEQLASKILEYRKISRQDQQLLMSMLMEATLNVQEQNLVNRLHDYLNRGLLRVTD